MEKYDMTVFKEKQEAREAAKKEYLHNKMGFEKNTQLTDDVICVQNEYINSLREA